MNNVCISLGSNMGNRLRNIELAMKKINENYMHINKISNLYETNPYGYTEQDKFLNCAVIVETNLSCEDVLKKVLAIEIELGRIRKFKWGPRNIDIDIIFYNNEVYNEEYLKVPHNDMQNRDFVLKPLLDICPNFVHPVLNKNIIELYNELHKQ